MYVWPQQLDGKGKVKEFPCDRAQMDKTNYKKAKM